MFTESIFTSKMKQGVNRELPLGENEFTMSELLTYLRNAYGTKLNGTEFTWYDITGWLYNGKMPECYGGDPLTSYRASGVRIIVLSHIDRETAKMAERVAKPRIQLPKKKRKVNIRPRTELYWQLAKKKPPTSKHVLPNNYKALGIKNNQLGKSKRK
jgi:hypothetical protein